MEWIQVASKLYGVDIIIFVFVIVIVVVNSQPRPI